MSKPKSNWIAAAQLGLVSSSFSTIVSQLFAARLGRDAFVDWMTVAAIPGRDWMLSAEPSWGAILGGIAFHQWADFSWAMVFFGLFGRWTAALSPLQIFLLAIPWAVFSSASEWFVLVPLIPFWQPLFTLQQPYWIGLLVHLASAAMYPLFAWLRWPLGHAPRTRDVAIAKAWGVGGVAVICILALIALSSQLGRGWPWMGSDREADQTYIRHMTTHHAQGIELAKLGEQRARDPHLKALARLMIASQTGEVGIFDRWWRNWFVLPMPECTAQERADMPGYLTPGQMQRVRSASADQFDGVFIDLMTIHHAGAVKMADEEWRSRGDPRLRIMALAIRHEQQGEIALMHGTAGVDAVFAATRNMLADNVN
ncbi:MAG TPA: DUF305 domain-containing protein [Bradyrhizobium sp.]|nr:DUF305 domain-containing protein [Bradyrhizobium sp.]